MAATNERYKHDIHDISLAVANYSKSYIDKKIEDLAWVLGGNTLDVDNDNTTAYQKSVPSGVYNPNGNPKALLNVIGGMSYKSNQLLNIEDETISASSITFTFLNGICNSSGTPSQTGWIRVKAITLSAGTYCYKDFTSASSKLRLIYSNYQTIVNTFTLNEETTIYLAITGNMINNNGQLVNSMPMLVSGSTAPTEFQPYFEDIRDSAVTSVVSRDSNNTTIDTYTIPAEIQALEGYGWGINDTCYNYVDFDSKKFIKKVGRVDLGSLTYGTGYGANLFNVSLSGVKPSTINLLSAIYTPTDNWNTFTNNDLMAHISSGGTLILHNNSYTTASDFKTAMSGVYLYYELATPIETDISQYIDNNFIEVEENGTITFNNTYEQSVPSEIDYLVKEVKA